MKKVMVAACAAVVMVCSGAGAGTALAQSVPAPWTARDIGSPALAGSATFSNGVFDIDAAGTDIWGSRDQFHFVYQAVSGDVDVRARIDSVTRAHNWSKAGVMIRGSLAADAPHGFAAVSAAEGLAFQRRRSAGAASVHTAGPVGRAPAWVRLVRVGNSLTAYTSLDGSTWTRVGSDTINLGTTAYIGIAVTSHEPTARTTAVASSVSIGSSALPAGQAAADVGAPAIKGKTSFSAGRYAITAGGADIWDSADEFHYVYQAISGDVDVVARVASITMAHKWSKAGVMIRETLAPGSRHAMALTSAAAGYAFQRRADTGTWSDHTAGGSGTPPGWVRLVRKGSQFEAFRSPDGAKWTSMGTATIAMNTDVYVGLAVTSHNVSTATTAVIDSLKVTRTTSSTNVPPAVVLSSPSAGATFTEPATLTLTATASDSDGTVGSVEFYANGTRLGVDTSAPYSVSVGSVPAGTYSLTAVATDDKGATTISPGVSVTVSASATAPSTGVPTGVSFTASTDHATLVTKYVLEIYQAGATPGSSTPVAKSDLAKPAPDSTGTITVDRSAFFQALAAGNYVASVAAVGSGGTTRSTAVTFTR